jgi:hypothetical protein
LEKSLDNYTAYKSSSAMTTCTTYKNVIQVRHIGTAYKFSREGPVP